MRPRTRSPTAAWVRHHVGGALARRAAGQRKPSQRCTSPAKESATRTRTPCARSKVSCSLDRAQLAQWLRETGHVCRWVLVAVSNVVALIRRCTDIGVLFTHLHPYTVHTGGIRSPASNQPSPFSSESVTMSFKADRVPVDSPKADLCHSLKPTNAISTP